MSKKKKHLKKKKTALTTLSITYIYRCIVQKRELINAHLDQIVFTVNISMTSLHYPGCINYLCTAVNCHSLFWHVQSSVLPLESMLPYLESMLRCILLWRFSFFKTNKFTYDSFVYCGLYTSSETPMTQPVSGWGRCFWNCQTWVKFLVLKNENLHILMLVIYFTLPRWYIKQQGITRRYHKICDMIKGNESHIGFGYMFNFQIFTQLFGNGKNTTFWCKPHWISSYRVMSNPSILKTI